MDPPLKRDRAWPGGSRQRSVRRSLAILVLVLGVVATSSPPATASSNPDTELEHCLRKGKIVGNRLIGKGVTRPYRLELECNGTTVVAAFKTLDEERKGLTRFENSSPELNFTDSFRYEVAAYLIDRYLGLEMVPVAVPRLFGRYRGAAIAWVDNAVSAEELRQIPLTEAELSRISYQEGLMTLFDGLIRNVDRNQGNMLITQENLKLHLIDHSRAFRQHTQLPAKLVNSRIAVPRDVYERLRQLSLMTDRELRELTRKSISRALSRAVIARAALIVEKIDKDRATYGDEAVFETLAPLGAELR